VKFIQKEHLKISSFINRRPLSLSFTGLAFLMLIVSCDSMQSVGNETEESNQTVQELTLIDGKGNLSVNVQKGTETYFSLDLGSAEADLYPAATVYSGWCASPSQQINTGNQTHHGVSLFTTFDQEKWKPVNYLLNQKETLLNGDSELTQKEIQAAIWSLMNISDFNLSDINVAQLPEDMKLGGAPSFSVVKAEEIVNHVNNNYRSFEYTEHSTYAVVVKNASGQQRMIIENSPYFVTLTDLRDQYGLIVAWDINDLGEIIGGNTHVAADGTLTTMGSMFARAINNKGQVAGNNGKTPVIWESSTGQRPLYSPDGDWIEAHDINIHGEIAGELVTEKLVYEDEEYGDYYDYEFSAFVWDENQDIKLISQNGWANGINDNGLATGVDYIVPNRAFVWSEGAGMKGLGSYSGFSSGRANAINNDGQVVGSILASNSNSLMASSTTGDKSSLSKEMDRLMQATNAKGVYDLSHVVEMLQNATFRSESFPWAEDSDVRSKSIGSDEFNVNSFSEVIYSSTYRSEAFIWSENGGMTGLGTLGGDWSTAWDVNDHGLTVGYSSSAPGKSHAFFWDKELGMVELPSFGGNSLARAVNNEGQVVGYSYDEEGNFYPVKWEIKFSAL
jgi:probable HAF family extracellular repeat protein